MLNRTLAGHLAFFFMGLLLSVTGDEDFPTNNFKYDRLPFFNLFIKEKCSQHLNPLSCHYWDETRHSGSYSQSMNAFNTKRADGLYSKKDMSNENYPEEISIKAPFINSENHLDKRFTVFRRKNPVARGYKRGPGFRSWGGKRDSLQFWKNTYKKNKFTSWRGKRNEQLFPDYSIISSAEDTDAVDKRPKYQSWAGKKSTSDYLEKMGKREKGNPISYSQTEKRGMIWKNGGYFFSEPFKKHIPKRTQFQSWGGKRATNPWYQFFELSHPNGKEKRKFLSWGGERFDEYENQNEDVLSVENVKRHVFQNWGGKRMAFDTDPLRDSAIVLAIKESDSSEKTKELDKSKVRADWDNEEFHSNFDSSGDELKERTNKR